MGGQSNEVFIGSAVRLPLASLISVGDEEILCDGKDLSERRVLWIHMVAITGLWLLVVDSGWLPTAGNEDWIRCSCNRTAVLIVQP